MDDDDEGMFTQTAIDSLSVYVQCFLFHFFFRMAARTGIQVIDVFDEEDPL